MPLDRRADEHDGNGHQCRELDLEQTGIAAVQLLATGWSVTCGYRGGLVFPSVFMAVALLGAAGAVLGAQALARFQAAT